VTPMPTLLSRVGILLFLPGTVRSIRCSILVAVGDLPTDLSFEGQDRHNG
jgi:hypothetical protein